MPLDKAKNFIAVHRLSGQTSGASTQVGKFGVFRAHMAPSRVLPAEHFSVPAWDFALAND
jgi:hypothetical protein